jgi:hypothetical protein
MSRKRSGADEKPAPLRAEPVRPGRSAGSARGARCYLFGTIFPSAPTVISCDWLPFITVIL